MVLTLPLELVDEIVDEACRALTFGVQHAAFASSLARVCSHFRHRVNRTRFRTISFCFKFKVHGRPRTRLTKFGDLISADKLVWGKVGDTGVSGNAIAQHIREFTIDIMTGEGNILDVLSDGVIARIMQGLFCRSQVMEPEGDDPGDSCKFSLFCSVRAEGELTLLSWTSLKQDFVDAFRLMCTKSHLSSLSLKGFCNFPTHLVCESVIRQLRVESLAFQRTGAFESVSRILQPLHLKDFIVVGLRFGIPDDSMILGITSFTVSLWQANELPILLDVVEGISKLEKLCICIAPKATPEELVAFDRDLPYLKELIIDLDLWQMIFPNPINLPLSFILGPHTPPSVQQIEIRFGIYMNNFSARDDMIERLRNTLRLYSLHGLDQQLENGVLKASSLKSVFLSFSIKKSSYIELDPAFGAEFSRRAREVAISFFPLISHSKRTRLDIEVTIDGRREVWRRQLRNLISGPVLRTA